MKEQNTALVYIGYRPSDSKELLETFLHGAKQLKKI